MEFVEVTNTTDHDIDFNTDYQFQYIYKTQFTRLTVCTVEDAHKEALGEVTRAELDARGGSIEIDYAIEIDHALAGQNLFRIHVREKGPAIKQ